MTIRKAINDFSDTTSMHGVPKVINATSLVPRIFWSLVCLTAAAMFLLQVSHIFVRYYSYPKKVTIEVIPAEVPFPSISVCNMRNLDLHILHTLNKMFLENDDPAFHVGKSSNKFINSYMKLVAKLGQLFYAHQLEYPEIFQDLFSRTAFSANIPPDIIALAGEQLDGFLVTCFYAGHECDMAKHFRRFFDPYYYNCFTYQAPKLGTFNADDRDSLAEGIENGWSSIFLAGSSMLNPNKEVRMLPGLSEWRSPVSASEGIRVVIHPPGTQPYPFTEGFDVPPGFSASLGIKPRKNIRVGLPHGNCSKEDPFGGENNDIGCSGSKYRLMSCQKMCLQKQIMEACGCADVSLPILPNTDPTFCRENHKLSDICMTKATPKCLKDMLDQHKRIKCIQNTKKSVIEKGGISQQCNCFPPCEDVSYDVSYSLSRWPSSGYEGDTSYMGIFEIVKFNERFNKPETIGKYKSLNEFFNQSLYLERAQRMRNFARLNVYIADSNVIKTEETPDYTGSDVISDIGGQLGLWVGISVITLAEVFALVCDIVSYLLSLCAKKNNDLSCKSGSENNIHNKVQNTYSTVRANDDESDSNFNYRGSLEPRYSNQDRPVRKPKPIHIPRLKNTNDQWARKFADHTSREPSIPSGINLSNGFSEV